MRNDVVIKSLLFVAGAATGSIATWFLVKEKYQREKNEELREMREYWRDKYKDKDPSEESEEENSSEADDQNAEDVKTVNKIVKANSYAVSADSGNDKNERKEDCDVSEPYVVAPEEIWEQDYPTITLNYYEGDGVLTNERDEVIENVDELVGKDFVSHFGEYEDDAVHIRNDEHQVFYEILRNYGSFAAESEE